MKQKQIESLKKEIPKFSKTLEKYFKAAKWEWTDQGVPKPKDIEKTLLHLLEDLEKDKKTTKSSTGGLFASRGKLEGKEYIEIGFEDTLETHCYE